MLFRQNTCKTGNNAVEMSQAFHDIARFERFTDHGRNSFSQNFRKFRSKTQWIGSVQRESFEKTGPPFEVDHFSRSDRLENLDEWTAPLNWERYALQILFDSAYFLLLSIYGRRR